MDDPQSLSGEAFEAMRTRGILTPADRVELLEGRLVALAPWRTPRINAAQKFERWLRWEVGETERVSTAATLALDSLTRMRPDLVVGERRFVVEFVDELSQATRESRVRVCARGGVAEYWRFDLPARVLTVFREPRAEGYAWSRAFSEEESASPLFLPEAPIRGVEVFPRDRVSYDSPKARARLRGVAEGDGLFRPTEAQVEAFRLFGAP